MHLHRFFYNFDLTKNKILIQDKEIVRQIRRVLRLKAGKEIFLFNNKNEEVLVKILNFNNGMILAKILNVLEINRELQKKINLYASILKKENFELVCQKATEIGVYRIIPLVCERTVKLNFKIDRLQRIIKEAAEQSGRGMIPELLNICDFNKSIENIKNNEFSLFLDPSGEDFNNIKKKIKFDFDTINIFVGPEGGWSKNELDLFKNKGFFIIKVSPFVLRAETAALIGVFLASNL